MFQPSRGHAFREDATPGRFLAAWKLIQLQPDIKVLQIQLTGFLDKDTPKFCKELWLLCLSAQSNPQGVPKELLEAKKLELIQEKVICIFPHILSICLILLKIDAEKAAEEARRRKEQEKLRDRNMDGVRQRERGERGRGRGKGGRGVQESDRCPPRYSRSPPPRRRDSPERHPLRGPQTRRETDTYVPSGRGGRRTDDWRRRSPSTRRSISRFRSITPPRRHRYPRSRSPVTVRRTGGRRGRRAPDGGDDRARSLTLSETSRSRSPRRHRKGRSPSTSPRNPSPLRRSSYHHKRRSSTSISRSRSRSLVRERVRTRVSRRSPPYTLNDRDRGFARVDDPKGRRSHDDRHRSRTRSRSRDYYIRRVRAGSSRSRSPDRQRDRKRHRSIERYAPAARRRRNTSSVSSPIDKRRKIANYSSADDEPKRSARSSEPGSSKPLPPATIGSRRGDEVGSGSSSLER